MPAVTEGTCQACFNQQKLPGGMLSLHGYQRPGVGFIQGRCPGVGYPPYEESCELVKTFRVDLKERRIPAMRARLAELQMRPEWLTFYGRADTRHVSSGFTRYASEIELRVYRDGRTPTPIGRSPSYESVRATGFFVPSYNDLLYRQTQRQQDYIKQAESYLEFLAGQIRDWKPRPVRGAKPAPTPGWIVARQFPRDTPVTLSTGEAAKVVSIMRGRAIVEVESTDPDEIARAKQMGVRPIRHRKVPVSDLKKLAP